MPFVLEYDSTGKAVGGHFVAELEHNHVASTPDFSSQSNPLCKPPYPPRTLLNPVDGFLNHPSFVPNPLYHPPQQHPIFTHIYRARKRNSPPVQTTKADAFLVMFIKQFRDDEDTMMAFEALFTDFNKTAIDEVEFYAGIVMLLFRAQSWHLLPALLEVLPVSWQVKDLRWLHEAIEARYQDMVGARSTSSETNPSTPSNKVDCNLSDAMDHGSSDLLAQAFPDRFENVAAPLKETPPPAKRLKRAPFNGFRTPHAFATAEAQPLYVDPAALMLHQPIVEAMSDSDKGTETSTAQHKLGRKGFVMFKYKVTESANPSQQSQKVSVKPIVAKGKSLQKTGQLAGTTEERVSPLNLGNDSKSELNQPTSQAAPARKGRVRCGELYAAEINHFGHFPTRRAVIARTSRPYVHLCCGKGFSHPMDVKEHHRNRGRTTGGCPGKDGIPQGDDDEWDAHPSARIGYPDINYTKVRDGYVILDKASRDRIDNAIAAGLEYLAERGSVAENGEDDTEDSADIGTAVEKSSIRAAELGLRKRSKKPSH